MLSQNYKTLQKWQFCGVMFVLFLATKLEAQPWVQTFNPIRTFYVSPSGTGNGTQSNPMSLSTAINQAAAGDLYWLMAGTYNGQKTFTRNGTSSNPIVWRGVTGGGAIINGSVALEGKYNWVWGLEIKDPNGAGSTEGVSLFAQGGRVINCIIHDIKGRCGIGAWNQGSGQVLYGNIIYKQIPSNNNPHNLYVQNDYNANGYKYIVGNMLLDAWDATSNTYNFHAYGTNAKVNGMHAEKNIVSRGKFLIGTVNFPADNGIVRQNYLWNGPINFGYERPAQVRFENNYVGRSTLSSRFFWGKGEQQYPQTSPSLIIGNEFHKPSGDHFEFRTSAYIPNLCNGCPEIRTGDSWNNNTYSSPFTATFFADNNNQGSVSFTEWKTFTSQAGLPFDTSSAVVSSSPNKVAVIKNEYESGRGHIAIFNWSLGSNVVVDLSSILSNGTNFKIVKPRNMGSPVVQGTYNGSVSIPTGGAEFLALLVTTTGAAPPPPPTGDTTPPNISNIQLVRVRSKKVKIVWDTNEPADSQIEFSTNPCPCSSESPLNSEFVTRHPVRVTQLHANTTYHYRVKSRDAAGNISISSDRTFTTQP